MEQDAKQNTSIPPVPSVNEPPVISKHVHPPRVFMISIVVIITAILFTTLGFILGTTMKKTDRQQITAKVSPNATNDQSIQLDLKRVTNFTSMSAAINAYTQQHHGKLPKNLQAPELTTYGYIFSFTDPQTNKAYDYHVTSINDFTLCTTFSNNSTTDYNNDTFLNKTFAIQAPHMKYKKGYSCVPFTLIITNPTPTPFIPSPSANEVVSPTQSSGYMQNY